jgi:hypothetical protein
MVEVFKTNVEKESDAEGILMEIHEKFDTYTANFDLEDCDKILRVESCHTLPEVEALIKIVESKGFRAEVLPDIVLAIHKLSSNI